MNKNYSLIRESLKTVFLYTGRKYASVSLLSF